MGELTRQLDAEQQAIDFQYDKLGRVTHRRELSGVSSLTDTTYTVENHETTVWNSVSPGKGQVLRSTYVVGEAGPVVIERRDYDYDGLGRVERVDILNDGLSLQERTTYDEYGRMFQQFDVSGDDHGIRYVYNAHGYLERLREAREGVNGTEYQVIEAMGQRGNVSSMTLANGVNILAVYENHSGRLDTLSAEGPLGQSLQFIDYTWEALGNLTDRDEFTSGGTFEEDFFYDTLNRLEDVFLSIDGGASNNILALAYDPNGNIASKSGVGTYAYGDGVSINAGPHAVVSTGFGIGQVMYTYDLNGNQVSSSDGRSIEYSVFNKPTRIEKVGVYTEFTYGIGNVRIKRADDNGVDGEKTTWYFSGVERIDDGTSIKFRRYLGGVAIADYYPTSGNQTVNYLIKDHLGSIHTVTDDNGGVLERMSFTAFGHRRVAGGSNLLDPMDLPGVNQWTTRGFTGHEHADGLGVIHMNGRIYDPKLGRMLQADPIVQAPKNSQSLNRYSYVYNNPLSYTDPSGYFSLKRFVKKWGRVIVAAVVTYFTWGAASGWAAGFAWGSTAGTTATLTALGGAVAGAVTGAVGGLILTGTLEGAFYGALSGAALGAVGASGLSSASKFYASGAANGVVTELQGGKFGHGFVSAGAGVLTAGYTGGKPTFDKFMAAAIAGGTVSEITGGKFENGAFSAGLSYALASTSRRAYARSGGNSVEEPRALTYDEYLAAIEAAGVDIGELSSKDKALIKALVADELFQAAATQIYDSAVESGSESEMISIYQIDDGAYYLHVVRGEPCSNGSPTCMNLPDTIPYKGWKHIFDWHPHPYGNSLPSDRDYVTSARRGVPGVIWYRTKTSYGTTYYQGFCKVAGQC